MRKKKAVTKRRVKKATATLTEAPANHALMVPVTEEVWLAFAAFRNTRRENRTFPWTVRDCMDIAIREYLANHAAD